MQRVSGSHTSQLNNRLQHQHSISARIGGVRPRVLIVGAGIAGASAAYQLSDLCDVIVIESEGQAGFHSTGRSAAVLSTTSGNPLQCLLAEASRDFFLNPPVGFTSQPLTRPRGLLWIDCNESSQNKLDRFVSRDQITSKTSRRIMSEDCKKLITGFRNEPIAAGGVLEPGCISIDVAEFLAGYLRLARANSVKFIFDSTFTRALKIKASKHGWKVVTTKDELFVDAIVNASGAWSDEVAILSGIPKIGLQPYKRTACTIKLESGLDSWPLVMDINSHIYFEPISGGLLVSLAEETPEIAGDAKPDELDVALMLDRLKNILNYNIGRPTSTWAGLRTFATDKLPVVGPDSTDETFFWYSAQGGAGIKTAPALSTILRATFLDKELPDMFSQNSISKDLFSSSRFN